MTEITEYRNFDLNIEKVLEGWETCHAVRELIANALDEQMLTHTGDVQIYREPNGTWHIRDLGRGLKYEHLTQNENQEKLNNPTKVIGKFGVGLKDALATFNRRRVDVCIRSRFGDITLSQLPKSGFTDVVTLHAVVHPALDQSFIGTDVVLRGASDGEIGDAKNFFLKFSDEPILDETPYGQILKRRSGRNARIYVTGMLVAEEENFAFSFNITSLTATMRKALNRERTNVGRTAYSERVKQMLLASKSAIVADTLVEDLMRIETGTNRDEVKWTDVAVHASQTLSASNKVVFVTAAELISHKDAIDHHTPYFLNLHHRDVAHTMILGRTGAGKSFLLNFLITNLQKYDPWTFIFDLGGSFESLTQLFGGSYVKIGINSADFRINPFSLPPTKENLDFLALFVKVLLQGSSPIDLEPGEERDLYQQIENLYSVDPQLRTLGVLANTLGHRIADRLAKWTRGGQFGFLFDNSEDTISFSRFQCFDFQKMNQYPDILEPLLFYILHRANSVISDREISTVFKAFFIDEAWVFLKNPSIQRYIVEALKTWRKANAAMILSTQSLDELRRSEVLDVIIESCPTKIFLANPDMDRDLYRRQFHLNENEVDLISSLVPKQQFLIKTPELAKVVNLTVDRKSYWLYTNDPFDNRKRKEAFEAYGFEKGLDVLAGMAE